MSNIVNKSLTFRTFFFTNVEKCKKIIIGTKTNHQNITKPKKKVAKTFKVFCDNEPFIFHKWKST